MSCRVCGSESLPKRTVHWRIYPNPYVHAATRHPVSLTSHGNQGLLVRRTFVRNSAGKMKLRTVSSTEQETTSRPEWPEKSASALSQLNFSYMNDILALGAELGKRKNDTRGALASTDLPRVSANESTRSLLRMLSQHLTVSGGWKRTSILCVGRAPMAAAAIWQALSAFGQIAEPLLLRALVLSIGNKGRIGLTQGLTVASMIAVNTFCKAAAQQRQLHLSTRAGMRVRALAIAVVYGRVLKGTAVSDNASSLIAVDANKLFECGLDFHLIWSAPLQVVVVSGLLVYLVGGLAAFAGITVLIAVLPLAKYFTQKLIEIRRRKAPITDARVSEVAEVIASMRTTKFSGWELLWQERWRNTRSKEIYYTRREMFWIGEPPISGVGAE